MPKHKLPDALRAFVGHYVNNGQNGTAAWMASHPGSKSRVAAGQSAYQALKNPHVAALVRQQLEGRWQAAAMSAEEAKALLAASARADVGMAFDEAGRMLPPTQWPPELRKAVKSYKADTGEIVLHDGIKARVAILTSLGKMRQNLDVHVFDHAAAVAESADERLAREAAQAKASTKG
jgi:hypothetical protein